MHAHEIVSAFLDALTRDPEACNAYSANTAWTARATSALVEAGLAAFPHAAATAKGRRDRYGRSEYLALDACIWTDDWNPPLFIAEHDNYPVRERIQYSAWKLLAVHAERRVLVCYFDSKDAKSDVPSFEKVTAAVAEVCEQNLGKDILLIAADCGKPSSNEALRRLFKSAIVGFPLR